MQPFVAPMELPRISSLGFLGNLAQRRRRRMHLPGAEQTRRSCVRLDEFAQAVADLAAVGDDNELTAIASTAVTWSDRLWASNANIAEVNHDVRAATAALQQRRVNAILTRRTNEAESGG